MTPAIYARVSTPEQSNDSQLIELREFCQRRGWDPLVFTDQVTGSRDRRPGLDALMAAARRRTIDAVIVYRYDRFARSVHQLVNTLQQFQDLGIQFISLHEQIDTTTAQGRFFFHVCASFAELEREIIRERVKSGLAAAVEAGVTLGRRRVSRDTPQAIKAIALRARGDSWGSIARETGLSAPTVRRIVWEDSEAKRLVKNPISQEAVSS